MEEILNTHIDWLIIEGENYNIINENEVDYILDNGFTIKASLNLYTYDRNVSVFDGNGIKLDYYQDLSKERIVEIIRKYETF